MMVNEDRNMKKNEQEYYAFRNEAQHSGNGYEAFPVPMQVTGEYLAAEGIDNTFVAEKVHERKNKWFIRLIVLLACALVVWFLLGKVFFRLKYVLVLGNELKSKNHITMMSGLVEGLNLFAVNEAEVRNNLSRDHTIELLNIQKDYLKGAIYLYVKERVPVATTNRGGIRYLLDEKGMILEEIHKIDEATGMPEINGLTVNNSNFVVGQALPLRNRKQMEAYQTVLFELGQQMYADQVREVNLTNPEDVYLVTAEGITVRIGTCQDARAKVGAMRAGVLYLRQIGQTSGILDVTIPKEGRYRPDR